MESVRNWELCLEMDLIVESSTFGIVNFIIINLRSLRGQDLEHCLVAVSSQSSQSNH
jgi:hypothetical protein